MRRNELRRGMRMAKLVETVRWRNKVSGVAQVRERPESKVSLKHLLTVILHWHTLVRGRVLTGFVGGRTHTVVIIKSTKSVVVIISH